MKKGISIWNRTKEVAKDRHGSIAIFALGYALNFVLFLFGVSYEPSDEVKAELEKDVPRSVAYESVDLDRMYLEKNHGVQAKYSIFGQAEYVVKLPKRDMYGNIIKEEAENNENKGDLFAQP